MEVARLYGNDNSIVYYCHLGYLMDDTLSYHPPLTYTIYLDFQSLILHQEVIRTYDIVSPPQFLNPLYRSVHHISMKYNNHHSFYGA
jgi:hypothetical protein